MMKKIMLHNLFFAILKEGERKKMGIPFRRRLRDSFGGVEWKLKKRQRFV